MKKFILSAIAASMIASPMVASEASAQSYGDRYPNQRHGWSLVSPMKLGAWYLLMYISFVLVAAVHRRQQVNFRRPGHQAASRR